MSFLQDTNNFPLAMGAYELETPFKANNYQGEPTNPLLMLIPGSVPIVISAPHAVKHYRNQQPKSEDIRTGALARQLAQLTGAHAIISARTTQEDDPNWNQAGLYKSKLAELVQVCGARFVLDIHGMSDNHGRDVIIGTAEGKNLCGKPFLAEVLLHSLQQHGLSHSGIDELRYKAASAHMISSYISREYCIPTMQLEIARKFRNIREQPANYEMLLRALLAAISSMLVAIKTNEIKSNGL